MSCQNQPSTLDFLKLIGLLVVIGVVAFDIFSVRSKNKALWKTIETQKTEMDRREKSLAEENQEQYSRLEQQLRDSEKRVTDAKEKARDRENELSEEIRGLKDSHRKELDELKAAYEKKFEKMKEDFNRQKENARAEVKSWRTVVQSTTQDSQDDLQRQKKVKTCNKCSGKGVIRVKKRCMHCNGSGRIKQEKVFHYNLSHSTRIGHVDVDCPSCLPGGLRGSGSKGYTIEKETCPKCNGSGKMEL